MTRSHAILALAALGVAFAWPLDAQTGSNPRSAGLAGAYMGLSRGYDAVNWNPANLALEGHSLWSLGLGQVTLDGAMLGPEFSDLFKFVTKDPTDQDRARILSKIPDEGLGFRGDGQVTAGALSIGPVAVSVSSTGMLNANFGREFVDLLLYARQYGDIDYNRLAEYRVGNTTLRNAWYHTVVAGYGRALGSTSSFGTVTVGVAGRFVVGQNLQRFRIFEPNINLATSEFSIPVVAVQSAGGTGYGVDFGIAAQPEPGLTLGIAVQNAFQHMEWDEAIEVRSAEFDGTELDLDPTELLDSLKAEDFDPGAVPQQAYETARDLFREAYFPRVIRVGIGYQTGLTSLGATFSTTQGKGDLHAAWPKYLAFGLEQQLPFLSFLRLRGGFATSLDGASQLAAGTSLGFGPLALTLAGTLATGNDEAPVADGTSFAPFRFSERLAAGSGYGLSLGLEIASR
ncbi:MAG: hypothetical protein HY703_05590 [Gemmatimonadetes bacterium]|nr:hypothetical protein [Gemmatimonadota bacterium]